MVGYQSANIPRRVQGTKFYFLPQPSPRSVKRFLAEALQFFLVLGSKVKVNKRSVKICRWWPLAALTFLHILTFQFSNHNISQRHLITKGCILNDVIVGRLSHQG